MRADRQRRREHVHGDLLALLRCDTLGLHIRDDPVEEVCQNRSSRAWSIGIHHDEGVFGGRWIEVLLASDGEGRFLYRLCDCVRIDLSIRSLSRWLLTKGVERVAKVDCFAWIHNAQLKGRVELWNHIRNNICHRERCFGLGKSVRVSIGASLSLLESGGRDGNGRG